MRFVENGPAIPDELLLARDQGRVVFFCGAGVSRAMAGLPDFFGLAESVLYRLGVSFDSPVHSILDEAREIEKRTGVAGLISADRIFGLLERDFLVRDIESAVALALKPKPSSSLKAHNILLDLATSPEGAVRLVTTNFDRLFDDCGRDLISWQPPRLPDPLRSAEINGIVYLHGKAMPDYSGAEGDGFILSSSEFGRAYLSDGWATSFIREIINRYVVIFVGYTADDPPVHYLLEALNKTSGKLDGVYAFQSGDAEDAASKWLHKGVEAIPYNDSDNHLMLWSTLEAWAQRARDPEKWCSAVIDRAKEGPERLLPHVRGQVAHIVSTVEGLRKFADTSSPPPAEWLCVFDPQMRYAKPGYLGRFDDSGPYVDPFEAYSLDTDIPPSKIGPNDYLAKREIPANAWDGFAANHLDRYSLIDSNYSAIKGLWAANVPQLPPRLRQMGIWIGKVADQPAAVWWAAGQGALHPDIRHQIRLALEQSQIPSAAAVRTAWRYLLEYWELNRNESHRNWFELTAEITKEGWSRKVVRKYAAYFRPYLKAGVAFGRGLKPPAQTEDVAFSKLISLDVVYPDRIENLDIPDNWVSSVVEEQRNNLEVALNLETEIGGYGLSNISSIVPMDGGGGDNDRYGRRNGLSGAVIFFSALFEQLVRVDPVAAKKEFSKWLIDDSTIFARMRIWAAGKPELVPNDQFGSVFVSLSDEAFWSSRHQRDLLITLASRWNMLSETTRIEIEKRLLKGPSHWESEATKDFQERSARSILDRLTWLQKNGCQLCLDIAAETLRLQVAAPEWKPEYADKAAESLEGKSGWVQTRTEHSSLMLEPLSTTLSKARKLIDTRDDFFERYDPFAGLVIARPVRALSALRIAAKHGDLPEWAWHTFLNSEARKSDKPKFMAFIAEQLARYSTKVITALLSPATSWFLTVSKELAKQYPASFDLLVRAFIQSMAEETGPSASPFVQEVKEPDWTMEAINAPAGKVAQALFDHPLIDGLKPSMSLPSAWLEHVSSLISLPGDMRRHALVIFTYNLNWFYAIDPEWAEKNLILTLDSHDSGDKGAFWSGFFWGAKVPKKKLYIRMKPYLVQFAKEGNLARKGYGEVLSGVILAGWGSREECTNDRYISDGELRGILIDTDDEFRSHLLWQVKSWASEPAIDGPNKWTQLQIELLRDVWPRQKSVKGPKISSSLCDLVLANEGLFPELVDIVLPLLTKIDSNHLALPNLGRTKDNIVERYPEKLLALLYTILPDNVSAWPYGIGDVLMSLGTSDNELSKDERLIELKRKWNSR